MKQINSPGGKWCRFLAAFAHFSSRNLPHAGLVKVDVKTPTGERRGVSPTCSLERRNVNATTAAPSPNSSAGCHWQAQSAGGSRHWSRHVGLSPRRSPTWGARPANFAGSRDAATARGSVPATLPATAVSRGPGAAESGLRQGACPASAPLASRNLCDRKFIQQVGMRVLSTTLVFLEDFGSCAADERANLWGRSSHVAGPRTGCRAKTRDKIAVFPDDLRPLAALAERPLVALAGGCDPTGSRLGRKSVRFSRNILTFSASEPVRCTFPITLCR